MKTKLLSLLTILPSLLLSYELEFSKSFSKDIQNDTLNTNITIQIDSKEVAFINEKIEFFQDFINDDLTVTKKNGNYNLMPQYSYHNNKQKFIGYRGSLHYIIETPKYEDLNKFVDDINSIKNNMNSKKVKLSVSNLRWVVSTELYEKNIDAMRIESIKWIKNYIQKIDDGCSIKNITINKNYRNNYTQRYSKSVMMENSSSRNITPSQTKQSIVLNTNYKLQCK